MMLTQVRALVCRTLKPAETAETLSVVLIETTRPLYLVFGNSPDAPLAVVQFGGRGELLRLHRYLSDLHALLPRLVPASLSCVPWDGETYVHIQEGIAGLPWFNLRHRIGSCDAWKTLRDRALKVLEEFQAAIRKRPDWVATVDPGKELLLQLGLTRASGIAWPGAIEDIIVGAAARLQSLGRVQWPFQHGDFCFNNLLISDDALSVIDFEEFGQTAVPLHDELSLAFSTYDFMSDVCGTQPLAEQIRTTVAPTLTRHSELRPHLHGFVLHHLLWRINQCASRSTRKSIKLALIEMVHRFATGNWQ